MAQKVEIHVEDDFDGGTITFSLDSKDSEIDLSATNAEKLRGALRAYAAAGHQTTRTSSSRSARFRASSSAPDTAMIRAWAKENGHGVSDHGRIHQSVKDADYAVH